MMKNDHEQRQRRGRGILPLRHEELHMTPKTVGWWSLAGLLLLILGTLLASGRWDWTPRLLLLLALLLVSGCAKKKVVATTGPAGEGAETGQIQEETLPGGLPGERLGRARRGVSARAQAYGPEGIAFESEDIHFEFDQATLTPEARQILQRKAAFLQKHPEVQITIEGHCDQRGSSDYNLALGQRRADSVKTYLEDLGIAGNRLATVSYGKEQPLDPGMNEAAFARNRRAHLVIGGLND